MRSRLALRVDAGLLPLFLISAASVGYETALTRYFAVAKFSEYGYWVISIVMAGLALSGVAVALARGWMLRHQVVLRAALPALLIVAAALGYQGATTDPFNPLQLQNPVTWQPQLGNIGLYYLYLLPFFFLAGVFISLSFVLNERRIGTVYGYDMTGAGMGALLVLLLMRVLHPFMLVPALLVPLALAAIVAPGGRRALTIGAALLCLAGGELLLIGDSRAAYNDFKPIYAPLHVPNGRVLATLRAPRGLYTLMDDFTERVDTDVSNDSGMLGLPGPPATYGLYRDGNRIAALPRPGAVDARYAPATLAALPYALRPHARVLMAGPSGGFRIAEALALGAASVTALEPDPVLRTAERGGLPGTPATAADPRVRLLGRSPVAAARADGATYDIIDISADFLDEAEGNAHAFTTEAIHAYLDALAPAGVLSIPVSIREFPAYAVRMLATVRAGLIADGQMLPQDDVVVYRSAWNVRILVRRAGWDAASVAAVRRFADDRSFDVSYYPGIDVLAARAGIYNDLPSVSFERGEVASAGTATDAVADEASQVLQGRATVSQASFNLAPITEDRPFFYDVLRLNHLPLILRRIEILPQAEIAPLVNLAVLVQAVGLAVLVLAVPLVARGRGRSAAAGMRRVAGAIVYFGSLGLGFLFIEIVAIEKAAFLLNDRATAFALVLTAMLICSGIGSLVSGRIADAQRGLAFAAGLIVVWCAGFALLGDGLIAGCADWPFAARVAVVLVLLAPASIALGMPFPLGLRRFGGGGFMLPWAWAVNGALSVVATPLANLGALVFGLDRVLFAAMLLYGLCYVVFPTSRKSLVCPDPIASRLPV